MTASPFQRRRRFGLQVRLTAALVLIVMAPFALSAYLIDQIDKVSANFAANEAAAREGSMEKALDAYRELFDTTKRLQSEIADRLSHRPQLIAFDPKTNLDAVLDNESGLRAITLERATGEVVISAERPLPGPSWRDKVVEQAMASGGGSLRLTFIVPATLQDDYANLKSALDTARRVAQVRTVLPRSYRIAFLAGMGIITVAAALVGMFLATLMTRRLGALVTTARRVSDGKLDARVALRGRDEMAELGSAFNTMLDDLAQTRNQIQYLQRIGAWQDVARSLAHEIKNPLTPIQLAVQQCVSQYKGDDARFASTLKATGEIVEEEIAGLRRLVDTFRTLGQLPKVEAAPIALDDVIADLSLDPVVAQRLKLVPPPSPVDLRADKLLLKRVLANLVENGIHAGQEAGTAGDVVIGWSADPATELATVTVDDHGKGVSDDRRAKIFEPYVTSKATGTGLGLAIARKIAIEHGGELAVAEGNAPTGGARFILTLPLRGPSVSRI